MLSLGFTGTRYAVTSEYVSEQNRTLWYKLQYAASREIDYNVKLSLRSMRIVRVNHGLILAVSVHRRLIIF